MITRTALVSDEHLSLKICPSEAELIRRWSMKTCDLFLGPYNPLSLIIDEVYERQHTRHMNLVVRELEEASEKIPFDFLISLGDLGSGWGSKAISDKDAHETQNIKAGLIKTLGVPKNRAIFVPGNHELGGNYTWASEDSNPPDQSQFDRVSKILGPTHGHRQLTEEFHFIWLSTAHVETLFAQNMSLSDDRLVSISKKSEYELDFLETTLESLQGKFFLGIHDPGSFLLPRLQRILILNREKLAASFTGHIHAQWLMNILKWSRPAIGRAFEKYNIQFLPSVWGAVIPIFPFIIPTGAGWAELLMDGRKATLLPHIVRTKPVKGLYRLLNIHPKGTTICS